MLSAGFELSVPGLQRRGPSSLLTVWQAKNLKFRKSARDFFRLFIRLHDYVRVTSITTMSEKLPHSRGDQSYSLFIWKAPAVQDGFWQRNEWVVIVEKGTWQIAVMTTLRYYLRVLIEELRRTTKKVRIVSGTTEIRTGLLSNGTHKDCRLTLLTLFICNDNAWPW
jgi:hypothetical protein